MKLLAKTASLLSLASLAFIITPASAATLAEFTGGAFTVNTPGAPGQSFTVTGSGSFTNIRFNFFANFPATTQFAIGTGFLLSSSYAGTPAALSSGTAGYLGQATASGGFYNFGSGVTLVAGNQYFFYATGSVSGSDITGGTGYVGGNFFLTNGGPNFSSVGADANFRVTGDAVGAPDGGSTALLFALGVAGLWFGRRARQG
jgi:hypothetical protein